VKRLEAEVGRMCQFVDLWLALKGLVSLLEMRLFDLVVVNLLALAMLLLLLLQAQVLDEVFDLFIAVGVLDGGRLLAVEGPRVQACLLGWRRFDRHVRDRG